MFVITNKIFDVLFWEIYYILTIISFSYVLIEYKENFFKVYLQCENAY